MEGRCQCSLIKFTTPLPHPLKIYICHCTECRHQSSSAFGITAVFPQFQIPAPFPGAIGVFTRRTASGRDLICAFCTKCGSRLTHRAEGEEMLSVKGGCLDGLTRLKGAVHIWCKEAVVEIPEGVERYEGEPPEEGGSFGVDEEDT